MTPEEQKSDFHQFFIECLQDTYWAENAMKKALPDMVKNATSPELKSAFEKHISETENHIQRLEKVFASINEEPKGKVCDAMKGILSEADSIVSDTARHTKTRDAALILAAQKAEHYEIATYGTLRVFAEVMGHTEAEKLLSETLANEKETDVALTVLAEQGERINEEAAAE